jgi:hypothetical protein
MTKPWHFFAKIQLKSAVRKMFTAVLTLIALVEKGILVRGKEPIAREKSLPCA